MHGRIAVLLPTALPGMTAGPFAEIDVSWPPILLADSCMGMSRCSIVSVMIQHVCLLVGCTWLGPPWVSIVAWQTSYHSRRYGALGCCRMDTHVLCMHM